MGKKKDGAREIPINFVEEGDAEMKEPVDAGSAGGGNPASESVVTPDERGTAAAGTSSASADTEAPPAEEDPPGRSTDEAQSDELTVPGLLSEIAELTQTLNDARQQVENLTREKSALYDQVLRRQAEFENSRKRLEREKTEFNHQTRRELLLELLPVLDNFDRALASLEKNEGDPSGLRHGVELIHKQLKGVLARLGLEPLESVGRTFDPNVHEAITVEPSDEHQENTVIEEIQRGYKLGDRLLRPAKVKVASSPER